MQSDWHRYNLKRRVASLPPLTSEIFTEKVLANQASAAATAARASFERVCAACQRTYFSENAYQNHLGSQKHKVKVAQLAAGTDVGTEDDTVSMISSQFSLGEPTGMKTPTLDDPVVEAEFSEVVKGVQAASLDEESPVGERPARPTHSSAEIRGEHPLPTDQAQSSTEAAIRDPSASLKCLFCNTLAPTLEANVKHMQTAHGMFVPERAYLVDLDGLINYLYDKIHDLHECLYCGQVRYTATGTQTHMRDKGHCMIAFESEAEMLDVGEFYDFRATYSDDEDEDSDEEDGAAVHKDGPKLGGKRDAKYAAEDGDEDMQDGGEWESDDEEAMSDAESTATATKTRHSKRSNPRLQPAYVDEFELRLPSGRTAGHRSLARYYRQNLNNYPTPEERAEQRLIEGRPDSDDEGAGSLAQRRGRERENRITRANGGTGMLGVSEFKKKEVQRLEVHEKKREERARAKVQWGKDLKGNNQKHFRVSRFLSQCVWNAQRTNRCSGSSTSMIVHPWSYLVGISILFASWSFFRILAWVSVAL